MSIFTPSDLTQIRERGSVVEDVEQQFAHFKTGFPYSPLNRPATVGDGIIRENHKTIASLITAYDDKMAGVKLLKFVPASGAASRMFKPLFDMLENDDPQYMEKGLQFITDLKKYPFYHDLTQALQSKNLLIDNLIAQGDYKTIIRNILFDEGLDYSQKPKALLKFHREPENEEHSRYAVEEHLVEAACYAKSKGGICHLHFTVSPHHLNDFNKIIDRVRPKYEQRFGVKYDITYSVQNPATDTLAATEDNLPFRNEDGQLLFRPGGHGALISNLNELDADLIFVKNIDNVANEARMEDTIIYKKYLALTLVNVRNRIFDYLKNAENENDTKIKHFLKNDFGIDIPDNYDKKNVINFLNRPIRICGMVKNEGEPGGGPFWANYPQNSVSLQIVETSQIDKTNAAQKAILEQSSHFNPVDMVCSIKNYNGEKFNLKEFVDNNSGFISEKSYNGKILKAMELPGLWNGAMAGWLTLFVEVPLSTFNPVKTVFDLKE